MTHKLSAQYSDFCIIEFSWNPPSTYSEGLLKILYRLALCSRSIVSKRSPRVEWRGGDPRQGSQEGHQQRPTHRNGCFRAPVDPIFKAWLVAFVNLLQHFTIMCTAQGRQSKKKEKTKASNWGEFMLWQHTQPRPKYRIREPIKLQKCLKLQILTMFEDSDRCVDQCLAAKVKNKLFHPTVPVSRGWVTDMYRWGSGGGSGAG